MEDHVTLLTCTGDRSEAIGLCEGWMAAQDYKGPVQWIVVDDGYHVTRTPDRQGWAVKYVWRDPTDGFSLHSNILEGLKYVTGDVLLFIEDDDYYAPGWLSRAAGLLREKYDLVGLRLTRYYNVAVRALREMPEQGASSLSATGLRTEHIDELRAAIRRNKFCIDGELWKAPLLRYRLDGPPLVVGIKGLPGRAGFGVGHRPEMGLYTEEQGGHPDHDLSILRELIGDDADCYAEYAH